MPRPPTPPHLSPTLLSSCYINLLLLLVTIEAAGQFDVSEFDARCPLTRHTAARKKITRRGVKRVFERFAGGEKKREISRNEFQERQWSRAEIRILACSLLPITFHLVCCQAGGLLHHKWMANYVLSTCQSLLCTYIKYWYTASRKTAWGQRMKIGIYTNFGIFTLAAFPFTLVQNLNSAIKNW